jgi:hypothetical protein
MLNLQLHIQPQTEQKLKKILTYTRDEEMFAQNIIAYQVNELQKGILNLRLDMKQFEDRYQLSTEEFYRQFEPGIMKISLYGREFTKSSVRMRRGFGS